MKIHTKFLIPFLFLITIILLPRYTFGQEEHPVWKRSETEENLDLHLFRSTQSINLPTAETLEKNNLQFEISHRFIPTMKFRLPWRFM